MSFIQVIKDLTLSFFIGGFAAASWVVPLIDVLYKVQFTAQHLLTGSKENEEFIKLHEHKSGTPNLGGILIWITVPTVLLILFGSFPFVRAVSFMFLILGLFGFIEKAIDMVNRKNMVFRELSERFEWRVGKLLIALIVNFAVAFFIISIAGIQSTNIFGFILQLDNPLGYFLVAGTSLVAMYATEIIDGLDALAAGMYIISLTGFILLALAFPTLAALSSSASILSIVGIVIGVLAVYLYFNIPPARVFMGGPGAMPMGPLFLMLALYLNAMPAFFIFMIIYFIDLASSAIQIISIKFFKKRIFRIAPIHHHFESLGWPEYKVVMRFWLFNGMLIMLGVLIQLFLNT